MLIKVKEYLPESFRLMKRGITKFVDGFELEQYSGLFISKYNNVLAHLETPEGGLLVPASNIVTSAGDVWYAQRASTESPTNAFNNHVMCSAFTAPGKSSNYSSATPIGSTNQANDATYPRTADPDTDNTNAAANAVTHRVSYTRASFAAASITHGLITIAAPSGSSPLLTAYAFSAAFAKTVDDTLKVSVSHQILGS